MRAKGSWGSPCNGVWRYRQGVYGDAQDEETTRERVANALSGGVVSHNRKMPSGSWVESIWTPISGSRLVGFSRDITVLKQREAELEVGRILLREVLDSPGGVALGAGAEGEDGDGGDEGLAHDVWCPFLPTGRSGVVKA